MKQTNTIDDVEKLLKRNFLSFCKRTSANPRLLRHGESYDYMFKLIQAYEQN